jgi:serine phosphatase RsbU (regulator of sigma subunit)
VRFESFAQQFTEKAQATKPQVPPVLKEDYWRSVRELFTRDVTSKGFSELVQHDAGDTLRFFLREVDLEALKPLPWHKRYAFAAWKLFLAMAYRLSPVRRILFAVAVPVLLLGWLHTLISFGGPGVSVFPPIHSWEGRQLIAGSLLFVLLLLELRDKLSLKGDLEIARQIQFGLVPSQPFSKGGFEIHASMRPANTVGGDYYDVIDLGADSLALAVADVAGKGMPAALLMAMLQGSLRTLITAGFRGSELITKLNAHLLANIPPNRLVTFFYAELQTGQGSLRYVNAGHNPPFVLRKDGALDRLDANGVALGILGDARFETSEIVLQPGDRLLLYTDGVTEAFDLGDREYGEDRLIAYLVQSRGQSQQALIDGLKADVLGFCGPARPRDDMTLMVVGRSGD